MIVATGQTGDAAQVKRRRFACGGVQADQPAVFFLLQQGRRARFEFRRDDDFRKNAVDGFRGGPVQRAVDDDHAAKRRLAVGGECAGPGVFQRIGNRRAARIGVLQDGAGRFVRAEFADEAPRRVKVYQVVEG